MKEKKEVKKTETTEKKKNKFLSVKLWVTLWAMVLTTYIIIANRTEFYSLALTLCYVPLAYIGANVLQKKIINDSDIKKMELEGENEK